VESRIAVLIREAVQVFAAANLGTLRRTAVSLLQQNKAKGSNKLKAFRASIKPTYLLELLQGNTGISMLGPWGLG
jgi:hypothetical protein